MSAAKKLLAGVLVVSLVGASGAGALNYIKKSREVEVLVVQVNSLASDYYTQDTTLDGNVTTNVSQNIRVDKDMIVDQIYVGEGDTVSIGEPLVSFDMTLVEMELNIARLKHQKLEMDYAKANKRLNSLRNGGPIHDSSGDSSYDDGFDMMEGSILPAWNLGGFSLASVSWPSLLAMVDDFGDVSDIVYDSGNESQSEGDFAGEDFFTGETGIPDTNVTEPEEVPVIDDSSDEFATEEDIIKPVPDKEQEIQPPPSDDFGDDFYTDKELADEWEMNPNLEKVDDFYQTDMIFYERLDGSTIPLTGSGTEEDPFIFLCSSEPDAIIATGEFLNVMAGYNASGSEKLHKNGFWYQLEFHADDNVLNTEDRMESCYGYFLVDGGLLKEPVYPFAEMEYLKEEATLTEPEEPDDYGWGGGWDGGGGSDDSALTRPEAIRLQESRVNSLKISIEESSINISKLERKVKNQVVYARLDGIVGKVGDTLGGSSGDLMTIKSKKGYYVTGMISELMLDEVQAGTKLSCMSYQSGTFDATILEVADYPSESRGGFYGGDSNPNVSYYRFSAEIDDQSLHMSDGDWLQITLKNSSAQKNKLVLSKAFVRSENGKSYVYKEEDGVLKKQYVKVGGNVDYGYSVIIQAGLSRKDYIAFPYGKNVMNGVKTRQGTTEELYGY